MSKLEEMLEETGEVWFELGGGKYDRRKFLCWAKANGLKWMNGEEIKETDDCFFHMIVSKYRTIANISTMCFIHFKNKPKYILDFKDFLKNR